MKLAIALGKVAVLALWTWCILSFLAPTTEWQSCRNAPTRKAERGAVYGGKR